MFDHISEHLEVRQKYSVVRRVFNSLLGVWKCGQIRPFVFDILLEINRRLQFWRGNPRRSEVVREGTNYKLNFRDHFYLKDIVGGFGIMLLKFRLLRSPDIF